MNESFRLVGKVKEAHGLRGDLYVLVFSGEVEWLPRLGELQLSSDEGRSLRAFKLKKTRPHKQGFVAQCDEINNRTQAESLKGDLVYIPSEYLQSQPGEKIFLAEIESFEVIDSSLGRLGTIEGFGSNSVQDLILIHHQGELVAEVPLVEAFIERIDFEERRLYMNLPAGLIEEG